MIKKEVMKNLSDAMDMNPLIVAETPSKTLPAVVGEEQATDTHVDADFEYARLNLRELIAKGNDALDNLAFIAKNSEHPRAYEVIAMLIKTLTDANKDMIELQKKKVGIEAAVAKAAEPKKVTTNNTNNNLFIGSTSDLQKLLNKHTEQTIYDADDDNK